MAMLMPQISTICNAHLSHAKWDSSKVKDWGRLVGDAGPFSRASFLSFFPL